MGFIVCTVNNILCPETLDSSEEKLHMLMEKNQKKNLLTGGKKNGRNLRKSHRGGIPLPGRTDMQ